MLPPTSEDTRVVAQLAWLIEAGADIWPAVRLALGGPKMRAGGVPDDPVAYVVRSLQNELGERYEQLLAAAPARHLCFTPEDSR